MRIGSQVDIFLYRLQVIRKEGGWIVCARTIHWMASKTDWVVSSSKDQGQRKIKLIFLVNNFLILYSPLKDFEYGAQRGACEFALMPSRYCTHGHWGGAHLVNCNFFTFCYFFHNVSI